MSPSKIAWLLIIAMIGFVGWQGYESYNGLIAAQATDLEIKPVQRGAGKQQKFNAQELVATNVFGMAPVASAKPKQEKPVEIDVAKLPETKLKLTLKGAFRGKGQRQSYALISEGNAKEKAFFVNDRVSGGAVLHIVNPESVVLMKDGRLEALSFKRDIGQGGGTVQSYSEDMSSQYDYYNQAPPEPMEDPNYGAMHEEPPMSMSPEEIMQGLGVSDPQEMMDTMNVEGMPGLTGTTADVQNIRDRLERLRQIRANR